MQLKRDNGNLKEKSQYSFFVLFLAITGFLISCNSNNKKEKNDPAQETGSPTDTMQGTSDEFLESLEVPFEDNKILSSVLTIHPENRTIPQSIFSEGIIAYDTRHEVNIAARYSGRIEKLYVKYMYQPVKKGDILFEIYSPEMLTEQNNLLFLLENNTGEQELIESARKKLMLKGMTKQQIDRLVRTKRPFYRLPVYSHTEGHIYESHEIENSMQTTIQRDKNMDELSIREGMYVQAGQTIFNILDPQKIWAVLKIFPDDANKVKLYQHVQLAAEGINRDTLSGQIDFIEPIYGMGSKNLSVRVYLDNINHTLKIGMYLKAKIDTDSITGLWIPKAAILDLGKQKIVWLKEEKYFITQVVKTGIESGNYIQIINGLSESDEIASNAQYIADSESFINPH